MRRMGLPAPCSLLLAPCFPKNEQPSAGFPAEGLDTEYSELVPGKAEARLGFAPPLYPGTLRGKSTYDAGPEARTTHRQTTSFLDAEHASKPIPHGRLSSLPV